MEPSSKIKLSYDGENIELVIKDADSETDSGYYKCLASNPSGRAWHGAKITVDVDKVTFTKKLQNTEIEERETLILQCETSHTVTTKWYHDSIELTGMDHREVIQDGKIHKLVIKTSSTKDKGKYKCIVKNQKTECTVIVKETKLEFVKRLQDLEVKEKECAILEVELNSDRANVDWYKDGQKIEETNKRYVFEKQGYVRKLIIRSASIHDEGEYTCKLTDQECSADVTVIELPPEIISKLKDQTINKGEKGTFEIELTKGDALVRWFKDGQELQFSEHVQLSIDGKRQKLKIYNSELEDGGVYSCQVGDQTSKARLIVNEPPFDFLTRLPEVTYVPLGKDVEFSVKISRIDAQIKWYCKETEITESMRHMILSDKQTRTLIIKQTTLEDQEIYSCSAFNMTTSSRLVVQVEKKTTAGPPSPPRGPLDVSGMTATSFTLKWLPSESDGGSNILEYIVEMKEADKKTFKQIGASKGKLTELPISDLKTDVAYNFKITARNEYGLSEPFIPDEKIVAGQRLGMYWNKHIFIAIFYIP